MIPKVRLLLLMSTSALVACGPSDQEPRTAVPEQALVFVKGGAFRMGTDADDLEQVAASIGLSSTRPLLPEVPAHEVSVDDFHMDRISVTNRAFAEFVAANPNWSKPAVMNAADRYLEHWVGNRPPDDRLDHPVTFITWHSAVAYCEWREKRLPTEAEYEWAAQDGTSNARFPWGDDLPADSAVNWGGNGIDTTVPVASYPPNARGLYDMSGNVWHFTSNPWLGSYEASFTRDDAEAAATDPDHRRVVRGGSFGANAANLRVRYRDSHRPFDAREMVGFRCARSAD